MKNLDLISEELFNKIRGRFPSVTIGDSQGNVTNVPKDARYFDFDYNEGDTKLGKISISLTDDAVEVMYADNFVGEQDELTKTKWYDFLKELRQFSKKRLLKFDTRNINKSNLDRRDYAFLATNRGDNTMSESKMYGTNKLSYQNIDNARIVIKHTESVNPELGKTRTRNIGKIYIESADGERFLYPYKHLTGARAMARHVAEGGKPFDDFGTHIVGLSEEMNKLRKFKSYMGRSAVMAESLAGYMDVVKERINTVRKTIESLQKPKFYAETIAAYEKPIMEDVPSDVAENWIDQLTIKQFNEELQDIFPYIYKLVSENTVSEELGPEDLLGDDEEDMYIVQKGDTVYSLSKQSGTSVGDIIEINGLDDSAEIRVGQELIVPGINQIGASPATPGATRGIDPKDNYSPKDFERLVNQSKYEEEIENSFEEVMGQFAEAKEEMCPEACCGKPVTECACGPDCEHCDCHAKNKAMNEAKKDHDDDGDIDSDDYMAAKDKAIKKAMGKDDEEIEEQKIPVSEFVLSLFDREQGTFPKGETAVLTAIEKDYGEQYIEPAKAFIERVQATFEQYAQPVQEPMIDEEPVGTVMEPTVEQDNDSLDDLLTTGVKGSYDFIAKSIKDFEELIRNNPNHPKVPQVKAELAKLKPQLAQARKDSGMGETTMDEDLSQNYASDAEAIQALMAKGARSNEETQYLTMLARKYDFYGKPENIPAAIEKAKKAAAKQPGGVNGQGAKMTGPDSSETYTTKDFPSMAAAMAKVDYYEPGGRITIDGKPYVRDVDEKGNKFFRPDTRKPAPAKPAPAQGQPTSRLDTKGQIPSAESVELDRIKGLAGL